MQLDANLRSFYIHCKDHELAEMTVLYRVSDERNKVQYLSLAKDYPQVRFVQQDDFRNDVLSWMTANIAKPLVYLYKAFTSLFLFSRQNKYFKVIFNRFLRQFILKLLPYEKNKFILFLVDDNIFIRDFSLKQIIHQLKGHPKALGFSLRLGQNTTYCYTLESDQSLPVFSKLDNDVIMFKWIESEYDFSYPLEVSSSVYRTKQILPLLLRIMFANPNALEGGIANLSQEYMNKYPDLMCFETSVAFCNPVNIVQKVAKNRAGTMSNYSVDTLCQLFDSGKRIDVDAFNNFIPTGCHQEVGLKFKNKK